MLKTKYLQEINGQFYYMKPICQTIIIAHSIAPALDGVCTTMIGNLHVC